MESGLQVKPHGRIDDIEMLRAVAIIFVLIEHVRLNLFPWVGGENEHLYVYFGLWTGVDLFFAISGFVIARSLLPKLEIADGKTAFFNTTLAFWVRRAWRLLPSAWLWLGVIMLAVMFFNRSGAFGTFRANFEGALAAILYVANFRIVHIFLRAPTGASFPYWSLSLEEQFYLLLPIVVLVARRWLPYVLGAAIVAQLFVQRSGVLGIGLLLNQIRSDALLLGVLIAIWSRHPTYRLFEPTGLRSHSGARLIVCGGLVAALAAAGSENLNLVTFRIGLVAILAAVLVLIASFDKDYLSPGRMLKPIMLWIGSRSYALYLIHIPAYLAAREFWFRIEPPGTIFDSTYSVRFALTAAPLLLLLADANYRFVEVPFRRRGALIAQRLAARTS
jgi:peptidoglycan/LPS O-acetylase OafA/YrhL